MAIASSSCLTILYTKSFVELHERKKWLTIPILSANFLLWGRVFLLTRVPSGYNMKQRGFPSFSASLPRNARWVANCCRSEAQERARKMKLKNCIPCREICDQSIESMLCTHPANDWDPTKTLLQSYIDIPVNAMGA